MSFESRYPALNIRRTFDADEVLSILKTRGIWDEIGGADGFVPPVDDGFHYLVIEEGGEVAGLFILHEGEHGLKIHANMIPGFRGVTAYNAARNALDYGFEFADKIYAEIPEEFPNVRQFAEQFLKPVADRYELERHEWVL